MSFPIKTVDRQGFTSICDHLSKWGAVGQERIEITRTAIGFALQLTSLPSWIEKILAFFGYKKKSLRLQEVAHFCLNWLRAHALKYREDFQRKIPEIIKLYPLMEKANLTEDFKDLISSWPLSVPFHFPPDFPQKAEIEGKIREILILFFANPGTWIERIKKTTRIIVHSPLKEDVVFELPFKVDFFLNLNSSTPERRIIIKTNTLVGSGGQRKVKEAFDILCNERLVCKKYVNYIEQLIRETLASREIPSCAPIAITRPTCFYEKRFNELSTCFQLPLKQRFRIVQELVTALSLFHKEKFDRFSFFISTNSGRKIENCVVNLPLYHGDITAGNILLSTDNQNELHPVLSDFGASCQLPTLFVSPFFAAPEKAQAFQNAQKSVEGNIQHNQEFGQKSDVWSLGLVLVLILSGGDKLKTKQETKNIPNLACFRDIYERYNTVEKGARLALIHDSIAKLQQADINRSIEELKEKSSPNLNLVWDLVLRMLQINIEQRISIKGAVQRLSEISSWISIDEGPLS